jgi:large subunit ribosomal protein L29
MKAKELREMSAEQLNIEVEQAVQALFRLRVKSQSDSQGSTSSEMRRNRKLIARVKTIQRERELAAAATEGPKA